MTVGLADREMTEAIARQGWLAPIERALGQGVGGAFRAAGPVGSR